MIAPETIDRITRFDAGGLPVVSLYLRREPDRRDLRGLPSRASSLLHEIRPMTKDDSLDREARLSVRGDLERIEGELDEDRPGPTTGALAIFSCSGRGFYEEVELPRPVRDRIVVDATPWVRPMLAVLDEYHRTCVLVVDSETARTWELYQDEIRETSDVFDRALHKPEYADRYGKEERARNEAEGLKRHFRTVAGVLDDFYRAGRFELLVIGGHEHEIPVFEGFLSHNLRGAVAGTVAIDPSSATIADIRSSAEAVVDRYERDEERQGVAEVFEKRGSGGLAAVGAEGCLWAGSIAAIQQLLVHDDATAPGVVCDESGWLGETGDTCPLCGKPTRATDDVIDELAEAVIDAGGTIEHVYADTQLRDHLVAADLRFPLPPPPGDEA
jgi:peptide subunit release factor 1 (eRF1)